MIGLGDVQLVARKAHDLTQEEVCIRLGITQAILSRYENELRAPDVAMATHQAVAVTGTPSVV
jgi:transcriptional regulator with XRE-family HTH domain